MKNILFAMMILVSTNATASESGEKFGNFFEDEITKIDEAMMARESGMERPEVRRKLQLTNFALRLRASVGFVVPLFAELKIVPMIELHWARKKKQ